MPTFIATNTDSRNIFTNEYIKIVEFKDAGFLLDAGIHMMGPFHNREDAEEARLFFAGIKPALSFEVPASMTIIPPELLKRYSFMQYSSEGFTHYTLFHDEKDLQILEEAEDKSDLSKKYFFESKKVYGRVLGYPPVATEDFLIRLDNLLFNPYNWASIYYHGIRFVCREENIDACAEWLEKTYAIPEKYKTDEFAQLL